MLTWCQLVGLQACISAFIDIILPGSSCIAYVREIWILIYLLLKLLKLHLLDVLADLFCEKLSQLVADVMLLSEGLCKHVWVIAVMDENVIVLTFSYFNCESQYFLFGGIIRQIILLDSRSTNVSTFVIEMSRH